MTGLTLTARKEQELRGREIVSIATGPMIIPEHVEKKASRRLDASIMSRQCIL